MRKIKHRGAARRHRRPQRQAARAHARARRSSRSSRAGCRRPSSQAADAYRKARSRRRAARASAAARPAARARAPPPRGRSAATRRPSAASAAALARASRRAAPVAVPPRARRASRRCAALPPPRARDRHVARDDPRARDRGHRRGAVLQRDDQDRRPARARSTTCASARTSSPASTSRSCYLRDYPHKELGAQLFGTLREISPEGAQEEAATAASRPGTRIGAGRHRGDLRPATCAAQDGYTRVVVNALGNRDDTREVTRARARAGPAAAAHARPRPPARRQQRAASARSRPPTATATRPRRAPTWRWTRATARCSRSAPTRASTPTCSPSRSRRRRYDALNSEANGAPLFNRAIAAAYPTGSTFKPITAMAALESGLITPTHDDLRRRRVQARPADVPERQGRQLRPARRCRSALKVSSDVFFYKLGERANARGPIIQDWAKQARPRPPDRDRHPGRVRRPGARPQVARRGLREVPEVRQARTRCTAQTLAALYKCGGIERPWSTGDNVNLAVGQGDLQATPLQMATAYSAIANGGTVVRAAPRP